MINIDISKEKIPVELTIYHKGHEKCERGHFFGPYIRDHYLIHFIKMGKGIFEKGGEKIEVKGEEAFIIYPGEKTKYIADLNDPWEYYWIGFQGIESEEILRKTEFSRENPVLKIEEDEVFSILSRMLEIDSKGVSGRFKEKGLMYYLLGEFMGKEYYRNLEKCDIVREYVRLGVQFVNRNYGRRITVGSVSEYLGIDRSYMSRIFKEHIKISPKEYLMKVRMERAIELLNSTSYGIGDIAQSVGYKDTFTFSKAFKAYAGASPTKFKNSSN